MADHPRTRHRRRHRLPHHPVPGRGRRTRRPDRRPPQRHHRRRRHPDELKRLIPGGHIRLRFTDPTAYQHAVTALPGAASDDDALTLQLPSDGSQRDLRTLLDQLDAGAVHADELTVHTPDLDDVFFALTGDTATVPHQPTEALR